MLLYGAGGHATVIQCCLHSHGGQVSGFFDDNPLAKSVSQIPFLGKYNGGICSLETLVIAIGDNFIRKRISENILHRFGNVCHVSALIGQGVQILEGTVIMHRATIQAAAYIGRHVIVNTAALVEHGCVIADFVHLAPGVVICGNVKIGENTLLGAGCVVAPNLEIGRNCMIAAGSVITRSVPDYAIVRGNPGRIIKFKS